MARSRRQTPIPSINLEGLSAKNVELGPAESAKERDLRLWKEKWSFIVNELLASIVAFGVLLALVVFSFIILVRASSSPDDRKFATALLAAVGSAVAGFVFGRGKK